MTGRRGSISNWLPELAVPVLLTASEAAWFSLLVAGRARVHDRIPMDVPYLGVALPAVVAVVALAWGGRYRGRRSLVIRGLGALVGAALTAAILSSLTVSGSFVTVATHPWSSSGHDAATVAWIAWWVAIVAWARGAWLVWNPVSTRHAGWSLSVAGVAYLGIFIGRAAGGHGPFVSVTGDAGLLFFVSFLLGGAAFAFARQRDIEADAVPGSRSRTNLAVGGAVAIPLAVVGLIGVAIAFIGGPAASLLGAGIRLLGRGLARALVFLLSWIPSIHLKGKPITVKAPGLRPGQRLQRTGPPSQTAEVIALVILSLLVAGLLAVIVVMLKRRWPKRRHRDELDEADEEQDSVFSWGHVLAQLRAGLRRLLPHRRRRRAGGAGAGVEAPGAAGSAFTLPEPESVRAAYRRMLIETRSLGSPRRRAETTVELEARLLAHVGDPAAVSLRRLTAVYDDVRYGGRETDVVANRVARQDVDEVLPALRDGLAPPVPETRAQPEPGRPRTLAPLPVRRRWWQWRRTRPS